VPAARQLDEPFMSHDQLIEQVLLVEAAAADMPDTAASGKLLNQ
jgi:hypothetical protein